MEPEADCDPAMRVVLVRNLHDGTDAPTEADARRAWMDELIDEVWLECCLHGEVQRIVLLRDFAAVRFQSLIAAAAAVDAIDGRCFAERTLKVDAARASRAYSSQRQHSQSKHGRPRLC